MNHGTERSAQVETTPLTGAAKHLGQTIYHTAEYRAFAVAEERYRADRQAQDLLGQLQESQRTLQLMRQLGSASAEETTRFEELQQAVNGHQTLRSYFEAQENLIALLREINEFVSERLNLDFAGLTKPTTGCC